MISEAELRVNIRNTELFISQRPISLILTPLTRVRITGGGYKDVEGTPRAPQTFRIIENGMVGDDQHLQFADGQQRRQPSWLLGMPGAAVEMNDFWFAEDGRRWRVSEVIRDNGYEMRAVVEEVGK